MQNYVYFSSNIHILYQIVFSLSILYTENIVSLYTSIKILL
ncbi:hypothetical protein CLOSPI_02184 [Thomasclavelia spiroformis DSM 1552]|uniref:Uncharacterized protein n=1 Tax=Thomasclavelia spiroformis DSM 1552 TaxID=428126 RepID=B1C515_9FIRM|nr:hypothetical protein CLOSPI_02184 [Thomasclavelia spiroformis DSM 1552]